MEYRRCTYRVSAKALIKTSKGLLLVKEDSQYWDVPGGGVEHFEDPVKALEREINEELGSKTISIDKKHLKAWATYDKEHSRPLLFLVYPVELEKDPEQGQYLECEIGIFNVKELEMLAIEPHLGQYRQDMIDAIKD